MFIGIGRDTATAITSRFVVSGISVALTVFVNVSPLVFVFFLFFVKMVYPLRLVFIFEISFLKA